MTPSLCNWVLILASPCCPSASLSLVFRVYAALKEAAPTPKNRATAPSPVVSSRLSQLRQQATHDADGNSGSETTLDYHHLSGTVRGSWPGGMTALHEAHSSLRSYCLFHPILSTRTQPTHHGWAVIHRMSPCLRDPRTSYARSLPTAMTLCV